jgi:hypothetical protein
MCLKGLIDMIIETSRRKRYTTKSLLHFDGTDGSTTFIDEKGNIISRTGSVSIDTGLSKFGGASGFFNEGNVNTGYLTLPGSADLTIGTQAFTVDFWVNAIEIETGQNIFSYGNSDNLTSGFWLQFSLTHTIYLRSYGLTIYKNDLDFWGSWVHIAIIGNGETDGNRAIDLYVNGVNVGTNIGNYNFVQKNIGIGYLSTSPRGAKLCGHMDELRISLGIQRWTSNFTPPSEPYTLD